MPSQDKPVLNFAFPTKEGGYVYTTARDSVEAFEKVRPIVKYGMSYVVSPYPFTLGEGVFNPREYIDMSFNKDTIMQEEMLMVKDLRMLPYAEKYSIIEELIRYMESTRKPKVTDAAKHVGISYQSARSILSGRSHTDITKHLGLVYDKSKRRDLQRCTLTISEVNMLITIVNGSESKEDAQSKNPVSTQGDLLFRLFYHRALGLLWDLREVKKDVFLREC